MNTLVTGGAGYIGAHVVDLLNKAKKGSVTVVDDLSYGKASRIGDAKLEVLDIAAPGSEEKLFNIIEENKIDTIIHFAARKQVGESVEKPLWYFQQNLGGITNLLNAFKRSTIKNEYGKKNFIFSSSAAVYGEVDPDTEIIYEDGKKSPINPYGETKLISEWISRDVCKISDIRFVGLRYFNVAGAGNETLGDPAILNLIPMVFDKLEKGDSPKIFGDDYPTPDGTCVRDYIHVQDLAQAHIDAIDYLNKAEDYPKYDVFNVGTGEGTSVKEIIDAVKDVTKIDFEAEVTPRRAGDPARLIASADRIKSEFSWNAKYDVRDMVESAWKAWRHDHDAK